MRKNQIPGNKSNLGDGGGHATCHNEEVTKPNMGKGGKGCS